MAQIPSTDLQMKNAQKQTLIVRASAIILFLVICLAVVWASVPKTEGRYIYPLDDTYITMAMAKNLSQHGVWGITRYEFSSSSSTPLYLVLLAICYRFTAVTEWWPLVLAMIFGALAIIAADQFLSSLRIGMRAIALLAVVLLTPLYVIAATGMEHCLHIWLALIFVGIAVKSIETSLQSRVLFILAPVLVLVRFESIFLVGICAVLFLMRKRWKEGLGLMISIGVALGGYSWFSLAHGSGWLPNPVLIKGFDPSDSAKAAIPVTLIVRAIYSLFQAPYLGFLVLFLVAVIIATRTSLPTWDHRRLAIIVSLLAILAHVALARIGFRYDAYLVVLAIVSVFLILPALRQRQWQTIIVLIAGALALQSLGWRSYHATSMQLKASVGVYEQQFQSARFLHRYFPQAGVAANDIGWISYGTDIHLLDLAGLASWDVFKANHDRTYTTATIDALAAQHGISIAIVYDSWFRGDRPRGFGGPHLPSEWVRVARWRLNENLYVGDTTVSFYATRPAGVSELRSALQSYASYLPPSVTVIQN